MCDIRHGNMNEELDKNRKSENIFGEFLDDKTSEHSVKHKKIET